MNWIETVRAIASTIESQRAESPPGDTPAGWDPYEVWLHRVHAPREARLRRIAPPGRPRSRDLLQTA